MKKLLISLIVFFSSFLLLNNVKADTCTSTFNLDYSYYDTLISNSNYDTIINHLKEEFENQNTYQYYIIYYNNDNFIHSGVYSYLNITMFNSTNVYYGLNDNRRYLSLYSNSNTLHTIFTGINSTTYQTYDTTSTLRLVENTSSNIRNFILLDSNIDLTYNTNFTFCIKEDTDNYITMTQNTIFPKVVSEQFPEISFTSNTLSSNNQIYENDVTIDFGYIDNDNYYYMYLDTNENIWHSLYLTNSTSYTINLYDNTNIIAQVIDKNTNQVFTNASYLVNNISSDLKIEITNFPNRNEGEQEILYYTTNITYYSDNRNNYIYDYTTSNYFVNGSYEYIQLQNNETNVKFQTNNNITIIARIKDLQGNVLYTKTTEITSFLSEPKISFIEIPDYGVSDFWYNSYVKGVILHISFGYIDTSKYIYLYKKDTDENWTTFNPLNYNNKGVNLDINENCNIIARVLNKDDNSVFTQANYTIYKIENPQDNSSFLGPLKDIFKKNQWRNFLAIFTTFFDTISEYRIITYILLIITTSIILLLLKSMKR